MVGLHKEMKNTRYYKYASKCTEVFKILFLFKRFFLKDNLSVSRKMIMFCTVYTEIKCMKKIVTKLGGRKLKYTFMRYLY